MTLFEVETIWERRTMQLCRSFTSNVVLKLVFACLSQIESIVNQRLWGFGPEKHPYFLQLYESGLNTMSCIIILTIFRVIRYINMLFSLFVLSKSVAVTYNIYLDIVRRLQNVIQKLKPSFHQFLALGFSAYEPVRPDFL